MLAYEKVFMELMVGIFANKCVIVLHSSHVQLIANMQQFS